MDKKQREQFLDRGFVVVRGCFTAAEAAPHVKAAYERVGCRADDAKTWKEPRVHAEPVTQFPIPTFAPKLWAAIAELVGGIERIDEPHMPRWQDAFIIKFPRGSNFPYSAPGPTSPHAWHLDGGPKMRHYLDSGEIGVITLALWSTVKPKGGGTYLACDSVGRVARYLAEHPEGFTINGFDLHREILEGCRDFYEFTGEPGDVLLAHPFMVHAESDNLAGAPRFQTVGMIPLRERLRFDRKPASAHSPVERAVLRALGRDTLSFARR